MIRATNHLGYECQVHTPEGWRATGFGNPHPTREAAEAAMIALKAAAGDLEFRVYESLAPRRAKLTGRPTTMRLTSTPPNGCAT